MAETASPPRPEAKKPDTDSEPLRIVLTSLDKSAEAFAREAAHEKHSKNPDGPIWKRVAKSAWNNLTQEYQIVKSKQEALKDIYENNNLLHHHGESDKAWRETTQMRYASDLGEELLRDGETFHKLGEGETADDENAKRVREDMVALVANRAKGVIATEASFNAALERMAENWKQNNVSQDFIGEGRLLGHNMDKMATKVRAMVDALDGLSDVEKQTKIDEILSNAEVIVGEAKAGSETEIEATTAERLAAKMQNVPFLSEGRLAKVAAAVSNETVVAGMISVATYGASRAGSMIATGLGGGAIAGIRERRALKAERALAERRRYMGAETTEMPDNSSDNAAQKLLKKGGIGITEEQRRAELDATLHSAIPAHEAMRSLGDLYDDEGTLKITNVAEMTDALQKMGEIKARSDRKLLSVQEAEVAEKESVLFDIQVALAKLETDMESLYGDDVMQAMLGIKADQFDKDRSMAFSVENGKIDVEVDAANKLMDKLMKTRVIQRTIFGGATGAVFGAVAHGVAGYFGGGGSSVHAPDGVGKDGAHAPDGVGVGQADAPDSVGEAQAPDGVGERAPDGVGGSATTAPDGVGESANRAPDGVGSEAHAPDGVGERTDVPDGVGSSESNAPDSVGSDRGFKAPDGVGEKTGAPDGVGEKSQAPDSVGGGENQGGETATQRLSEHSKVTMPEGYKADVVDGKMSVTTPEGKTIDGLQVNKDGSLTASAQNTLRENGLKISDHVNIIQGSPEVSHPTVSANEFVKNHSDNMSTVGHREWMPGPDQFQMQNHLNADGSITIDINGMNNPDWEAAASDGHMNVYLSASSDSSGHGFKVPIGPDGKATIGAGHEAQALFDNKGHFTGGYQEAAITGDTVNGAEHIAVLATAVGENKDSITDTITTQNPVASHSYTITASDVNLSAENSAFMTSANGEFGVPIYAATTRTRIGQQPNKVTPVSSTTSGPDSSSGPEPSAGPEPEPEPTSGPEAEPEPETTPPESEPEAEASTDGGEDKSGGGTEEDSDTGPESAATEETDAEGYTAGERAVLNALDLNELDVAEGFDFAGHESYSQREQKMAMQLLDIARVDAGEDADAATLARRAHEMAEAYRATSTPEMAKLYANTAAFLAAAIAAFEAAEAAAGGGSAEEESEPTATAETDAEKEARYFIDLDAEALTTPEGYDFPGAASMNERARKEAARFIGSGQSKVADPSDKQAVLNEALRLAAEAESNGQTDGIRAHYTETLRVLNAMFAQVRTEAGTTGAEGAAGSSESTTGAAAGKDKEFFDSIDVEDLNTPVGFDFPGYTNLGERERKQAARFIRQAIDDLGGDGDKVAVIEKALNALSLAAREPDLTDEMRLHLNNTMKVMLASQERVEKDAAKTDRGAASLLEDLDSDAGRGFPFAKAFTTAGLRASKYDNDAKILVGRLYDKVLGDLRAKAREGVDSSAAGYNTLGSWPARPADDAPRPEKVAYNKYIRSFMSGAMKTIADIETSLGSNRTAEQEAMLSDARSLISEVRSIYTMR